MGTPIRVHFLGASGTVTGSKYLIETPGKNLMVDCGLFQGVKKLRELNWQQLPVKALSVDLVILTHGHLDHCGYLPRLVKSGFRGPVFGTAPTLDIAEIILRDSAKIQEEDAERANKDGYSRHSPAKPLYNTEDAEKTISRFLKKDLNEWTDVDEHIRFRFRYNGHIIGATFIEMDVYGKRFVFSGDIGRPGDALLMDPEKPEGADVLFLESTYGGRKHLEEDTSEKLKGHIDHTVKTGGTLIIPGFAVERSQLLMFLIWQLHKAGQIPASLPVILDSPMGTRALRTFLKFPVWHKLSEQDYRDMTDRIRIVESFKETWEIIDTPGPKVIIAGSGMVTGGRVLTYLQQKIGKEETTVLLAGYQAEGTRGRQLLDGAGEIKFYGKYYPVKARVDILEGLSAHADQTELLDWLSEIKNAPEQLFLIHGEPQSLDMLRVKLKDTLHWDARIPELFEIVEIQAD